jgi:hypothetical protein
MRTGSAFGGVFQIEFAIVYTLLLSPAGCLLFFHSVFVRVLSLLVVDAIMLTLMMLLFRLSPIISESSLFSLM